jgi:hypothetical protein
LSADANAIFTGGRIHQMFWARTKRVRARPNCERPVQVTHVGCCRVTWIPVARINWQSIPALVQVARKPYIEARVGRREHSLEELDSFTELSTFPVRSASKITLDSPARPQLQI